MENNLKKKKKGNWITWLYTWNQDTIVNQLYFN